MHRPAVIRTGRLTLRPPGPDDAEGVWRALNDFEVVRWLTNPPWPYRLEDAAAFLARHAGSDEVRVIHDADGLVGCIGCRPEFGYWLARRAWGRGYATEAGRAMLGHHFVTRGGGDLISGFHLGNFASARVLGKLGFGPAPDRTAHSAPLGREVTIRGRSLRRADYLSQTRP